MLIQQIQPGCVYAFRCSARDAAGVCTAFKATALVTLLTSLQLPHECLPAGGTTHMMLLSTSSQHSLARLKAVNIASLRLAGAGDGSELEGIRCYIMAVTTPRWTCRQSLQLW